MISTENFGRFIDRPTGAEHKRRGSSQNLNRNQSYIFAFYNSGCELLTPVGKEPYTETWQNFFSTQFVHTDNNGNIALSENSWILAACVFPLTAATFGLWWTWVCWTNVERSEAPQRPYIPKITRRNSFRPFFSLRRAQQSPDLERGAVQGGFGVGTWSTTATTAVTSKSG